MLITTIPYWEYTTAKACKSKTIKKPDVKNYPFFEFFF
jgi:hypothetical protein